MISEEEYNKVNNMSSALHDILQLLSDRNMSLEEILRIFSSGLVGVCLDAGLSLYLTEKLVRDTYNHLEPLKTKQTKTINNKVKRVLSDGNKKITFN